jgi:membrane protein implicated in regulation of membrane protease activity
MPPEVLDILLEAIVVYSGLAIFVLVASVLDFDPSITFFVAVSVILASALRKTPERQSYQKTPCQRTKQGDSGLGKELSNQNSEEQNVAICQHLPPSKEHSLANGGN